MPYLHWEVEKRQMRMLNVVKEQTKEQTKAKEKDMVEKSLGEMRRRRVRCRTMLAEMANDRRIRLERPMPGPRHKPEQWRPTSSSTLGKYMWYAAKLFEVLDEIADERLVKENLGSEAPIHIRRTLDQFYHWTMVDTADQDHDQVVCRGTHSSIDIRATSQLVMVDQLWMWILDESRSPCPHDPPPASTGRKPLS